MGRKPEASAEEALDAVERDAHGAFGAFRALWRGEPDGPIGGTDLGVELSRRGYTYARVNREPPDVSIGTRDVLGLTDLLLSLHSVPSVAFAGATEFPKLTSDGLVEAPGIPGRAAFFDYDAVLDGRDDWYIALTRRMPADPAWLDRWPRLVDATLFGLVGLYAEAAQELGLIGHGVSDSELGEDDLRPLLTRLRSAACERRSLRVYCEQPGPFEFTTVACLVAGGLWPQPPGASTCPLSPASSPGSTSGRTVRASGWSRSPEVTAQPRRPSQL